MKINSYLLSALLLAPLSLQASDSSWSTVSWTTSDGVRLVGQYHAPSEKNTLIWVFLHGLGSGRGEWFPFVDKVAAQGQGVLVYDARGHGESTQRGKDVIYYQNFHRGGPQSEWSRMDQDLGSAIHWLKQQPDVHSDRIAVVGASLGANVALLYASEHSEIRALILLSPGIEYAGIQTPKAYDAYGARPLFMAASPEDTYAYGTIQQFAQHRGDAALRVHAGLGGEHGVHMLHDSFERDLLDWMRNIK